MRVLCRFTAYLAVAIHGYVLFKTYQVHFVEKNIIRTTFLQIYLMELLMETFRTRLFILLASSSCWPKTCLSFPAILEVSAYRLRIRNKKVYNRDRKFISDVIFRWR